MPTSHRHGIAFPTCVRPFAQPLPISSASAPHTSADFPSLQHRRLLSGLRCICGFVQSREALLCWFCLYVAPTQHHHSTNVIVTPFQYQFVSPTNAKSQAFLSPAVFAFPIARTSAPTQRTDQYYSRIRYVAISALCAGTTNYQARTDSCTSRHRHRTKQAFAPQPCLVASSKMP